MIANTKAQAIAYLSEAIFFEYQREVMNGIYLFLKDIGWKLPKDTKSYTLEMHEAITIKNPEFPDSVPFEKIYPPFFTDVISGVNMKGESDINEMVGCFNAWYNENWERFADGDIEGAVTIHESTDSEEGKRIEQWSDESIRSTYNTLVMIYGSYKELEIFKNTNGQMARLKKEYETRFTRT